MLPSAPKWHNGTRHHPQCPLVSLATYALVHPWQMPRQPGSYSHESQRAADPLSHLWECENRHHDASGSDLAGTPDATTWAIASLQVAPLRYLAWHSHQGTMRPLSSDAEPSPTQFCPGGYAPAGASIRECVHLCQSAASAGTWQILPAPSPEISELESLSESRAPWQVHLRGCRSSPASSPRTLRFPPHSSIHVQTRRGHFSPAHPKRHSWQPMDRYPIMQHRAEQGQRCAGCRGCAENPPYSSTWYRKYR